MPQLFRDRARSVVKYNQKVLRWLLDQLPDTAAQVIFYSEWMLYLNGTELDYKDELMQSGFVFNNPNVKGTCRCGKSFST